MSSNDLSQVRDYILARMAIVEPDFKEWKDSLAEIGNIPNVLLDKTFQVELQETISTEQIDKHIQEEQQVIISVFKRGYNTPLEARDSLLQTANCIRLDLIKPLNVEAYKAAQDGNIEKVVSLGLTPSEIDISNDNIIKVEIGLSVVLLLAST